MPDIFTDNRHEKTYEQQTKFSKSNGNTDSNCNLMPGRHTCIHYTISAIHVGIKPPRQAIILKNYPPTLGLGATSNLSPSPDSSSGSHSTLVGLPEVGVVIILPH